MSSKRKNRTMIKTILSALLITTMISHSKAQIDGDNLFAQDQVVEIYLTFSQVSYWDSLEAYYANEDYLAADLTIVDVTGTYAYSNVGVRFKGNSTYNHPNNKKSLKIDFNEYVSGQNYDGIKKLNLNNCFKDPSLMREKIFFDVCKEAGVLAPRANFADVYINGQLWGVYSLVEQIDDQFLDWAILDDNGNLFKAGDNFGGGPGGSGTPADLIYYGTDTSNYTDRYELKTNQVANDWTDLVTLIDYINNTSSTDFESQFDTRFEGDLLLRSIALDNLFSNLDSYLNSARNYYLYHNMSTNKWQWIKWDANETFGSYGTGQDMINLSFDYRATDRPLLDQIFNNSALSSRYKLIMCDIMVNYFNSTYMDPRIDAYYNLIKNHVYADTKKMYTDANFDAIINSNITTSGGPMGSTTTYGLKPFIASRHNSMSTQIDCYLEAEELMNTPSLVYPNPTNSSITIDLNENSQTGSLQIINTMGATLLKQPCSNSSMVISLDQLPSGIYFLHLYSREGNLLETHKINKL